MSQRARAGVRFWPDGAICPINTLAHLTSGEFGAHLRCMARHLTPGGRYLIQLAVSGGASQPEPSQWECERDGTWLRVTWSVESIDVAARQERHLARIENVSGERAGEVIEDRVSLTHWTPEVLARCSAISPFRRRSCYDGDVAGWPVLEPAVAVGGLVWHELSLR